MNRSQSLLRRVSEGPRGRIQKPKSKGVPEEIWVVTYLQRWVGNSRNTSTLRDTAFKTTIPALLLQGKGGLDPEEIVGIYRNERDAMQHAQEVLDDINFSTFD